MPSTVKASFERFARNLEITGLQASTVSTRQDQVRSAVENGMNVLTSFLTGSYIRDTMIGPLKNADIDIFTVLGIEHFQQKGQSKLLQDLRSVLKKRYPSTPEISPNGQAVTISFTDFKVDVVPAFNRQGGGFLIPEANNSIWISTDPRSHVKYKENANAVSEGRLVPLIKMIKAWNKKNNDAFESFYLEMLVIKILTNVRITDYPSGIRYFFDKGREAIKFTIEDPAGYGENIKGLKSVRTVDRAVRLFNAAYQSAIQAEQFNALGYNKTAIDGWKELFGESFPSYSLEYA